MPEQRSSETVFAVVAATPAMLRSLLTGLPADVTSLSLDEGWSPLHVVAHVLDTEDVIVERMRRIVTEERPFISSIDPTARLQSSGYLNRSIAFLLNSLAMRRAESLEWLRAQPPEALQRLGDHDEAGEISALDHAHQWAYHDLMHLKQLYSMLQLVLQRGMGNTRLFYNLDV